MAELEKSGKALHVYCDCGCHHKITKNDAGDYNLSTYFQQNKKQTTEVKEAENGKKEENSDGTSSGTTGNKPKSGGDKPKSREWDFL